MSVGRASLRSSTNTAPRSLPGGHSRQEGSSVGGRAQRGPADTASFQRETRFRRWQLRYRLQAVQASRTLNDGEVPALPSCYACGRFLIATGGFGQAALMLGPDGKAGYSGVRTCSSVSACVVCSARVRAQRTTEIEAAGVAWLRQGLFLGFGTLTLPHDEGEALTDVLGAVRGAWRYLQQDKGFRAVKEAYGLRFVRSYEFTYTRHEQGGNGWHPHMHVLWFSEVDLTPNRIAAMFAAVEGPWGRYIVEKLGRRRPTQFDLQAVQGQTGKGGLLRYLTKVQDGFDQAVSVAMEMTRGDLKAGRKLSRTPFEIAQGAVEGSVRDWRLWEEYSLATKGLRVIEPSRGLYKELGVRELADELAPDDGVGGYPLAFFDAPVWDAVTRAGAAARLLTAAETSGPAVVESMLRVVLANEGISSELLRSS